MSNENRHEQGNWPKDEFGQHEIAAQWFGLLGLPLIALIAFLVVWLLPSLSAAKRKAQEASRLTVIVYCAQDQTYAEPILRSFEEETGIRVRAVYDSEAVKTVGLANRLLAERDHPQCDVFWGNEEMRTRQLAALNVWRETNGFTSFGARARCLVINTNLLPEMVEKLSTISPGETGSSGRESAPTEFPDGESRLTSAATDQSLTVQRSPWEVSLFDLTNAVWRGKVAMAFPQFGTTATHLQVLRQHWGDELWQQWCRRLVANGVQVLDGNSTVVKRVGRGEAWIGLTDTDDVAAGQREGLPVACGPSLPETILFIPNTVGIVRGAPHPENAQQLADYLQRPETVQALLAAGAIQYAEVPPVDSPVLQPDWYRLLAELKPTTETLNGIFLR